MKARNLVSLLVGAGSILLSGAVWADSALPLSTQNLKGVVLATPQPATAGEPQSLRMEGEQYVFSASESEPETVYTLQDLKLQGGDDIATAFVIPGMPFVDTGTTVGYADDYSEACDSLHFAARPDVVFAYTPDVDELVNISLCKSAYVTRLWVYETSEENLVACNRFNTSVCTTAPRSALNEVPMSAGVTYYIVVDGDHQLTPSEGQYIIECSATAAPQLTDSVSRWPALGDNLGGSMVLGFSYNNGLDSQVFWQSSADDGTSFGPAAWWDLGDWGKYGSVDFWGQGAVFYGTFVPGPRTYSGGATYLHRFPNAADEAGWVLSLWDWSVYGWKNMRMADIACDNGFVFSPADGDHRFGIISMVHSSTYGTPDVGTDVPHLFYQTDSSDIATISWYGGLDGCRSTTCDIDKLTKYAYSVYDRYDATSEQWQLFVRGDVFGNPDDTLFSGGFVYTLDPGQQLGYPAVAASDGYVLIASEYYEDATPDDHDIILWYDPTASGRYDTLMTGVVVATTDDERYPRLQVISGDAFVLTYVANNQLYMTMTQDGGLSWTAPSVVSGTDYVVSEYRSTDIGEGGGKVVWEYQPGLPEDSTIYLHYSPTGVTLDNDGDGIDDDLDNCPLVANPDQEDINADGIGDSCCCVMRGDFTHDGSIKISDLTGIVEVMFRAGDPAACPEEADCNNDGSLKISDLTYLVNFLFRAGPSPTPC